MQGREKELPPLASLGLDSELVKVGGGGYPKRMQDALRGGVHDPGVSDLALNAAMRSAREPLG